MSDDPLMVCCQHLAKSQAILDAKDANIAQLKESIRRLAAQDATLSVCDGNVTVTLDATLTDEEREAVKVAARSLVVASSRWRGKDDDLSRLLDKANDTLRSLLERMK